MSKLVEKSHFEWTSYTMFKFLKTTLAKAKARRRILRYDKKFASARPMSERPAHMPIEQLFDEFVTEFGGKKVSNMIALKDQMPLNADYYFEEYNVIAELKTLSGIYSGDDALRQLTQTYIEAGCSGSDVFGLLFRGEAAPEVVSNIVRKRVRRSLEQRITKARQQLKKSKEVFGNIETRCIILIAMDQEPLFGHQTMLFNLSKIMGDNYSDIHTDGVVYFNPNVPTKLRSNGLELSGWFPFYRDSDKNEELSHFVNLLGNRWLTFFGRRIGETNPILELDSPEEMLVVLGKG